MAFVPDASPGEICAAVLHETYHIIDPQQYMREERAIAFEFVGGCELKRVDWELGAASLKASKEHHSRLDEIQFMQEGSDMQSLLFHYTNEHLHD